MAKLKAPVMLTILDGFGIGDVNDPTNAVVQAKPENFLKLWETYPHTQLQASGLAVGIPEGQMGNSEVGHLNIRGRPHCVSGVDSNHQRYGRWCFF